MKRLSRFLLIPLAAATVLGLTSCRRQADHEPVYPVTGKVFFKGKPAEWARVTLVSLSESDSKKPRPGAQVGSSGEFRLSTYASYDGAPAGRYAVTIIYPSPTQKENDENIGPDLLQGRYADAKTTPLRVEVRDGENNLEPFDLK